MKKKFIVHIDNSDMDEIIILEKEINEHFKKDGEIYKGINRSIAIVNSYLTSLRNLRDVQKKCFGKKKIG